MPRPKSRTPLKNAPRSSARCQPYVKALGGVRLFDTCANRGEKGRLASDQRTYHYSHESNNKSDQIVQLWQGLGSGLVKPEQQMVLT